jgi:protein SCO1
MSTSRGGLGKTFLATVFSLTLGLGFLLQSTMLGQAFTTETIRRAEVNQKPRQVPNFQVTDSHGVTLNLDEILRQGNRIWIVDFVYTRCQSICLALGSVYQQLQKEIVERGLQSKIGLLSVSFDSAHESQATLNAYTKRYQMNPDVWKIITLKDERDRQKLLDSFGIIVIKAPISEFEHNAALHLVDRNGLMFRILDYFAIQDALAFALNRTP